jgi:transcriptional regulator with XRE-family HTH domain
MTTKNRTQKCKLSGIVPAINDGEAVAESPAGFAAVLRSLRTGAGLTQEELAEAGGLSPRAISDLERGVVRVPHKDTVRLLAAALRLTGRARDEFSAIARGRAGQDAARGTAVAARTLPRDVASFTGRRRELAELVEAAATASAVVSIHAIGGMAGGRSSCRCTDIRRGSSRSVPPTRWRAC